jgi:AcrR family transcriptional regulator
LLDAACSVFGRVGFHDASMEAIAEAAGATKPTLYAHFGGKDALYAATLHREAERFRCSIFARYAAVAERSVEEQVTADTTIFFEYGVANPDGVRLLFGPHASGSAEQVREELVAVVAARTAEAFRAAHARRGRAQPGPSAEMLAGMVISATVSGLRHALADGVDPRLVGKLVASFAYAGMRHLDRRVMTAIDRESGKGQ